MTERILIFPANLPEAERFAQKAQSEGKQVIRASSIPNDAAADHDEPWITLPYIFEDRFAEALKTVLHDRAITDVFSSHLVVSHRLSVLLAELGPQVRLIKPSASKPPEFPRAWYEDLHASLIDDDGRRIGNVEFNAVLHAALAMRGESSMNKLAAMLALGGILPKGDVVEIGVLSGRSAFVAGWMARRFDIGALLALDPWIQSDAVQYDAPTILHDATRMLDFDVFFAEFLQNLLPSFRDTANYCRERATVVRRTYQRGFSVGPTEFGTTAYCGAISLLHVDGNHDFAAVTQDLDDWAPLVQPQGWIIVDDYVWSFGDGPRRAGDALLKSRSVGRAFVCDGALFVQVV